MPVVALIVIGAAAGFLATRLMRIEADIPTTMLIGIVGALVGGRRRVLRRADHRIQFSRRYCLSLAGPEGEVVTDAVAANPVVGRSLWYDAWLVLRRNRAAMFSLFMLAGYSGEAMKAELTAADMDSLDITRFGPGLAGKSVLLVTGDSDPVTPADTMTLPASEAYARINRYLRTGGMILFDTRDASTSGFSTATPNGRRLQQLALPLDIPPLEPIPSDHVLTRISIVFRSSKRCTT